MELGSCQLLGVRNVEVAPRFLENLCILGCRTLLHLLSQFIKNHPVHLIIHLFNWPDMLQSLRSSATSCLLH